MGVGDAGDGQQVLPSQAHESKAKAAKEKLALEKERAEKEKLRSKRLEAEVAALRRASMGVAPPASVTDASLPTQSHSPPDSPKAADEGKDPETFV